MGMDVHMCMEYCSRKTGRYIFYREFNPNRCYGLFGVLAEVFDDKTPLYMSRGFPTDASVDVFRLYQGWGGHHASWLNAEEFAYCLDFAKELYPDAADDWLKEYEFILRSLMDSDNDGEPARIVFWFDN